MPEFCVVSIRQNQHRALRFTVQPDDGDQAGDCDLILVVGSKNSSNSNRLREIAENKNIEGYLIDSAEDIKIGWLKNKTRIGLTAGASAPELLVQNVIEFLEENGVNKVSSMGFSEDVVFPLPKALR